MVFAVLALNIYIVRVNILVLSNSHCTLAEVGKGGVILELLFHPIFVYISLNVIYSLGHLQKLKVCIS